ncbi:flagellar export protein FliJ [Blautia pseudococcoides]|nr:flagellar export protein FliJ [Blautia pseudococcoides]
MARGRKKITETLEEQLEGIQVEIDKVTESLKVLKAKKKMLEGKLTEEKKDKLYQAVIQSGKNIDEILLSLEKE